MDGGYIHGKDIRQTTHFQRLIPQDRPDQLPHDLPVMAAAPEVHGQPDHLGRLTHHFSGENIPLFEQKQLHAMGGQVCQRAAVQQEPAPLEFHRRTIGIRQCGEV